MTRGKKAESLLAPHDGEAEELLLETTTEQPLAPARILEALGADRVAEEEAEETEGRRLRWLLPAAAILGVAGWLGAMGWLLRDQASRLSDPIATVQLVAALCVPPALIGIVYLLALRTSRAEASRFGATARRMRAEASALEARVAALAAQLEHNRTALSHHAAELMAMGESAHSRLASAAATMAEQSRAIDVSAQTMGQRIDQAQTNLSIVLNSLPKANAELHAMAAQLESSGLAASQRAASLDAQLVALGERGREADAIAGGAAERLAAHIARMEATSETAASRLEEVTGQMSQAVDGVLDRAAGAVDEARKGIATQGEAILAMLSANQAALDRAGKDSADALGERIAMIEEAITRISSRLGEERGRSEGLFAEISEGVTRFDRELAVVHAMGMTRTQELAGSMSALESSFQAMSTALTSGEGNASKVIRTSEDLLTALDASVREIDETLPAALDRLDARINASREVVAASKPELLALVTAATSTHEAIEAIAEVVRQQRDTLAKTQESLLETLASGREKADELEKIVDDAISTTRRFSDDAAPQLVDALLRIRETSTTAAEHARSTLAGLVPQASAAIEEASGAAIGRAVDAALARQLAEMVDASEAAVTAAAGASERLTRQMAALAEATAQLDEQVSHARAEHERTDADHFSRRVTLLIEAMNSSAIDIAKAFSTEVTDSAWAAYLRGDRGVFTRRAVRLLDPGEARDVHRLYNENEVFRDNVNRYIHDFEGMLRQVLALRDGSAMGVTLLSSDMGKLYVALAQAIERLRT